MIYQNPPRLRQKARQEEGGGRNPASPPRTPPATTPARSRLMARVRQKGTSAELTVRKLARVAGLKYLTNARGLPGSPDLLTLRPRRAVFVHGCFWHRHPGCRATTTPKSHRGFWIEKFTTNLRRDRRNVRQLRALGFRVMTIWECRLKSEQGADRVMRRLVRFFGLRRVDTRA